MSIVSNFPEDKINFAEHILNLYERGELLEEIRRDLKSIKPELGDEGHNEILDFIADTILGNNCDISIRDIKILARQLYNITIGTGIWNTNWKTLEDYLNWNYPDASIEELDDYEIEDAKESFAFFAECLDEREYAKRLFETEGYDIRVIQMVVEKASQNGHVIYNQNGVIFSLGKLLDYVPAMM